LLPSLIPSLSFFPSFSASFASFCSISFSSFLLFFIRVYLSDLWFFFLGTHQQRFARTAGRPLIECVAGPRDKKKPQAENLPAEQDTGRKEGRTRPRRALIAQRRG